MAKKITELTDLPTPVDADILPIVDDVAGTPTTKKVTLANLLQDAIRDGDLAGTYAGHLHRTGAGAYETIKSNLAATTAPTATDDTNSDYKVGSLWIDTTNDVVYICMDATASAAVWQQVGAGGGTTGSLILNPGGAIIPATGGAILTQVDGTNLPYYALDYDDSTDQSAIFQFTMPQDYDGGNFTINFHSFASATTGAALMLVEGAVIEAGELVDQALSSLGTTTINPAATTNQLVVDVDNTANTLTGLAGGDLVIFKFTRDADNASDTMTGDLRVVGFEIEYTTA